MSTVLDAKILPKVLSTLAKYGTDATFTAQVATYSPSFRAASGGTPAPKVWKMAPPAPYAKTIIDGDAIRMEDLGTVIAASGITFTPAIGMAVLFNALTYRVVSINTLRSGDDIAAYELQLRK